NPKIAFRLKVEDNRFAFQQPDHHIRRDSNTHIERQIHKFLTVSARLEFPLGQWDITRHVWTTDDDFITADHPCVRFEWVCTFCDADCNAGIVTCSRQQSLNRHRWGYAGPGTNLVATFRAQTTRSTARRCTPRAVDLAIRLTVRIGRNA